MYTATFTNEEFATHKMVQTSLDRMEAANRLYEHLTELWEANHVLWENFAPETENIHYYIDEVTNDVDLLDSLRLEYTCARDDRRTPFDVWEEALNAIYPELKQKVDALADPKVIQLRNRVAQLERLLVEKDDKPNFDFSWDDNALDDISEAIDKVLSGESDDEQFFVTGAYIGDLRFELYLAECWHGDCDKWGFYFNCYVGGCDGYATSEKDPGYPYDQLDGWDCCTEVSKYVENYYPRNIQMDAEKEFIYFILHENYSKADLFDKSQASLHIF